MFIIKKPKYKGSVSNKGELDNLIEESKKKYQKMYPNSSVNIIIEPDILDLDGTTKEFVYRAEITLNE
ncbi:hypothetical protein HMPREF1982_01221 [Clostridiales bacterium oral taxon 876 str. F0540]|nr:hypothetical protein HMPREF1982_01221 [Clostridiales bacterium oral taxon 876 str. F0540]